MKFKKTVFVITLLLAIVTSSLFITQVFGYTLCPGDDPKDDGGPGTGGTGETLKRTWKFKTDYGSDDDSDKDTYIEYIVKEYRLNDGRWKISYSVSFHYYYCLDSSGFSCSIQRYNPYLPGWYRGWIGSDTILDYLEYETFTEDYTKDGITLTHEYFSITESFIYDYGDLVGIQGGLVQMEGNTGLISIYYGCVLKFRVGESNYGSPQEFSEWRDSGGLTYGFFGRTDIHTTYEHPNNAWYYDMDDTVIYTN